MNKPLVLMERIEKRFPGVHALNNCRFELLSGEVHALVGENGAGKSTLMKILTGVYRKDEGKISYQGNDVDIPNTKTAQSMGINIIHQELQLMPDLSIAQNIFIGREPRKFKGLLLDDNQLRVQTKELLGRLNLHLDPDIIVSKLTVAQQQMVEIAKALSYNSKVLIMDEPTAALSNAEIEELFRVIEQLRSNGVGIVYISHRMDELKRITDRITVMRDGCYINTVKTDEVSIDQIISMMVGREIKQGLKPTIESSSSEIILEVKNLNRGSMVKDVSFHLKKGEILGFAGLMGAGRTEVARAIFGADTLDSGEIYIKGNKAFIKQPMDAVKQGIGYLSEDRKRYGLLVEMDVTVNTGISSYSRFVNSFGVMKEHKLRQNAEHFVARLKTKTPSVHQFVKNLSGGNQQKVVIGKWLTKDSDILIFDEPTRGIDVGAKTEIYRLLEQLASEGKSIIMISSELPEILRMSHRIMVMCEGRITGELKSDEATQENIMKYATMRLA